MNRLIQKIFENRGYTHEFLREFDNPEYQQLKDIDVLCQKLKSIKDNNQNIVVYPDFDMDGIASGVLGYAGLSELGFNVGLYIPDPTEGYGISQQSVADLLYKYPGTNAIITCDTGIGAAEAASYCKIAGVDFLVTDHHKQEMIIQAPIIVDPMRADETYPHQICGAFVFWQVLARYAQLYCTYFEQDQIGRLKVFAGIGTVSDSMPILYENRQTVRDAISICRMIYSDGTTGMVSSIMGCDRYKLVFWGLYDFFKICEENGIISSSEDIDEEFFGWYLAPIFNSAKRMNGEMYKAFGIFFYGNTCDVNPRQEFAEYLYKLNHERKELVAKKLHEALSFDQPFAPYVYISDADPGILGLLAMKLLQKNGVPTFVLKDYGENNKPNRYSGSGRSPEWFNSITLLSNVDYLFIAGHEQAFGCGIKTATDLQRFHDWLAVLVPDMMSKLDTAEGKPDYVIDTHWQNGDIGIDITCFQGYLEEIEEYRPFGKGFEKPVGIIKFTNTDIIEWKRMGSNKQHLKLSLPGGFNILCWNQGHLIDQRDKFESHTVVGSLGQSTFKGITSINFTGEFVEQ